MRWVTWLLIAFALCACQAAPKSQVVAHVIDGDTLSIGEVTYRLHGLDSPEAGQRCRDPDGGTWQCGAAATNALEAMVRGRAVVCSDLGKDEYDRVLSVCEVEGINVNEALVSQGYAWAFRKFSKDFVSQEDAAHELQLGIWQAPTQTAEEYRAERWNVSLQEVPDGCPIKGNISANGHIYHAPWSPWYDRTRVSVEKGERWFCDEREALDAGWRAPIWGN